MSTLHDRLADLAGDADTRPETAPPATGLWDRGRRYSRLRRGGTALIVATAVAVVAGVLGTAQLRAAPSPAPAGSPVGVPERIFAPSPYLEGTEDGGPLGRLAALIPAERSGLWGTDEGYVGVSAETGEYRFLDLPGIAPDGEVVLSPDGRHVAYWTTGPTEGSPNTTSDGDPPATGVALYDPATDEVVRHDIPTEHGIDPDTVGWAGAGTLLISHGQYRGGEGDSDMDRSSSTIEPVLQWDVGEPEPRPAASPVVRRSAWDMQGSSGEQVVVGDGEAAFAVATLDGPGPARRYRGDENRSSAVSVGPGGRWVSAIWGGPRSGSTSNPNRLLGGRLPAASGAGRTPVDLEVVPGSRRYREVVGWVDEHTVLAIGSRGDWRGPTGIDAVDLRDGTTDELVTAPPMEAIGEWQVATDLLREPTVEAVEPPRPMSPRRTAGFLGLTVVGAAGVLIWWRRRVRP